MARGFTTEEKKAIGTRIRNIRIGQGLTMAKFGEQLIPGEEIAQSIVSRWEKGLSVPNNRRLAAISKLGNISMTELLSPEPATPVEDDLLPWDLEFPLKNDPWSPEEKRNTMLNVMKMTDYTQYDDDELNLILAIMSYNSSYRQKPAIKGLSDFIDTLLLGTEVDLNKTDHYTKVYGHAAQALLEEIRKSN